MKKKKKQQQQKKKLYFGQPTIKTNIPKLLPKLIDEHFS